MTATGSDRVILSETPFLTSEGEQEMRPRSELGPDELLREVGSVLRMSEAEVAALAQRVVEPSEDQTMIINMGPQHPSTHGVLRLMLELQGETVLRCKPIVGYLHTGMEKTGEAAHLPPGRRPTSRAWTTRRPLSNELVFSMATEKLLGIDDDIPERAMWIRMLMVEINRMSQPPAVPGHQRHGHRRRLDDDLRLAGAGDRAALPPEGHRPADEPQLHPARAAWRPICPPGWRDDVLELIDTITPRLEEYDTLMTDQPIWRERLQGVGVLTAQEALALGRHRAHPALHRAWPGTSGGTCRTCATTSSSST